MMLSFLNDLFTQDFMLRALAAGVILGFLAPLIGSIVVAQMTGLPKNQIYTEYLNSKIEKE